jgi:ABC-type multidrug transport system permease subunit
VYVPIDLLNGWVEHVAKVNPITPVLEAGRSLLAGDPEKVGIALVVLAAGLGVFAFWARGGLKSAERAGA